MADTSTTPPVRSSKPHDSDHDSDYSLDLNALPDKQNDSGFDLSDLQRDLVDVVQTDDIDGPTDFTQNLEYWMRLKLPNVVEPTSMQGPERADLEQYVSSVESPSSTISAPKTPQRPSHVDEQGSKQDIKGTIERNSSRPLEDDVNENGGQDNEDDRTTQTQVSPSARPQSRLQAFVEDCEGSPSQNHQANTDSMHAAMQKLKDELRQVKHRADNDLLHLKQAHEAEIMELKLTTSDDAAQMALRMQELEYQLADEKEKSKKHIAAKEEVVAMTARLREQLTASAKQVQSQVQASSPSVQVVYLQKKIADRENALNLANQRAEEAETILEETSQAHREELQNEQEIHDLQVATLEQQMDALKTQLNTAQLELADFKHEMQNAEAALQEHKDRLAQREALQQDLDQEFEMLRKESSAAAESRLSQSTKERLASIEEHHARQLESLKLKAAAEKAQMQEQAENAVMKMRKLLDRERQESERLRQQLLATSNSALPTVEGEVQDLRNEVRLMNDHAEDIEQERDDLKADIAKVDKVLETLLEEHKKTKQELRSAKQAMATTHEEQEAINEIVAQRVRDVVRAKEEQWRRRLQAKQAELDMRSKLLMLEWGQLEFGRHDPQPYSFKYL